jgi:hypothetical protein
MVLTPQSFLGILSYGLRSSPSVSLPFLSFSLPFYHSFITPIFFPILVATRQQHSNAQMPLPASPRLSFRCAKKVREEGRAFPRWSDRSRADVAVAGPVAAVCIQPLYGKYARGSSREVTRGVDGNI